MHISKPDGYKITVFATDHHPQLFSYVDYYSEAQKAVKTLMLEEGQYKFDKCVVPPYFKDSKQKIGANFFTEYANYIFIGWDASKTIETAFVYEFKDKLDKTKVRNLIDVQADCIAENMKAFSGAAKIGKYGAWSASVLKCKRFLTSLLQKVEGSSVTGNQIEQFALIKPEIALRLLHIATDLDFKPNEKFVPIIDEQTGETTNKPKSLSWYVELENSELQGESDMLSLELFYTYELNALKAYQERFTCTVLISGGWNLYIEKSRMHTKKAKK